VLGFFPTEMDFSGEIFETACDQTIFKDFHREQANAPNNYDGEWRSFNWR